MNVSPDFNASRRRTEQELARKRRGPVWTRFVLPAICLLLILAVVLIVHHVRKGREAADLPVFAGVPWTEFNGGKPTFLDSEITAHTFDRFTELDDLGRCGPALACVGPESMPTGERGRIGMVRPSGWQLNKYDFIDNGGFLYNRCHLVAWQLTGQNAEVRNLITGTRFLNVFGMLPWENKVADYVRRTGNHVMYRAMPVFVGKELVARGVVLEAQSVEDGGRGLSFCVYCFNVQPYVTIDYADGTSRLSGEPVPESLHGQDKTNVLNGTEGGD